MAFLKIIFFIILICILASPGLAQQPLIADMVRPPETLEFCGESVPIEQPDVRERYEKEMLLALWDRPQVLLWLKRAPRYLPFISQQLRERQMPDDLKYLAIVESALRPHVGSAKGAIGFWQLLPQTARKYGLTVDKFIDQRRNILTSTQAALTYLQTLHKQFSSWTLSAAAYNMGEEGLTAEIIEQKTSNYYQLYLPLETQRFVFRALAVKLILSAPKQYGFELRTEDAYLPLEFDTASIHCFQEIPIRLVAEATGTVFKVIKDLNPELRGHYLRSGHHRIHVPQGKAKGLQQRLDEKVLQYSQIRKNRIYIVKSGDSLSSIAQQFDVPLAAIIIWNRIDLNSTLHPGDRLVIYPQQKP